MKRLAGKERFDGHGAAVDLAFFYREIDGAAALIAEHDGKFGAHRFFQKFGKVETRARSAAGAAFGRLAGFANILDGFVRTIGAHIKLVFALRRRADETVLAPIILDFLASDDLIEIESRSDPSESQGVRLGDTSDIICGDHRAGSRHVLDNKTRIAGNVFRHVLGDEPRPQIVHVAGGITGHDSNRLSLEVGCLSLYSENLKKDERNRQRQRLHGCPPKLLQTTQSSQGPLITNPSDWSMATISVLYLQYCPLTAYHD